MPQVPRYDGPQIVQEAMPAARITPTEDAEAFGAGASAKAVTAATQNLSETALKIVKQEREKADDVAILNAKTLEMKIATDAENMILTGKGPAAIKSSEDAYNYYSNEVAKIHATLRPGKQQFEFKKTTVVGNANLYQNGRKWVYTQQQEHDKNSTSAFMALTTENSAKAFADPLTRDANRHESELNEILVAGRQYAARNNWSQEEMDLQEQKIISGFRATTVSKLLTNLDIGLANGYAEHYKDDITETDKGYIDKARQESAQVMATKKNAMESEYTRSVMEANVAGNAISMSKQVENDFLNGNIDKALMTSSLAALAQRYDDQAVPEQDKFKFMMDLNDRLIKEFGMGATFNADTGKWTPVGIDYFKKGTFEQASSIRNYMNENVRMMSDVFHKSVIRATDEIIKNGKLNEDVIWATADAQSWGNKMLNLMEKGYGPFVAYPDDTRWDIFKRNVGGFYGNVAKDIFNRDPMVKVWKDWLEFGYGIIYNFDVDRQQRQKNLKKLEENMKISMNPDYTKYPIGSKYTTSYGSFEVVDHNDFGTPMVKIG